MKSQTVAGSFAAPLQTGGRSGSLTAIASGSICHRIRPTMIRR